MEKICIVAECMYCGGTEKSLLSLLKFLDRKKYEITLLLLKKQGDLLIQLPADIKVEEIVLPESEVDELLMGRTNALKKAIKEGHLLKALSKAIRGGRMILSTKTDAERRIWYYQSIESKVSMYPEKFDLVIDYMGYGLFNTFYAARKVQAEKRISWIHFECEQIPDFLAFRDILNEYDYIMCVSKEGKRQAINMMPELKDKCRVFYNIIDKEELYKLAEQENIRKEDGINILSIGRLDPQKGFDIGIKAISRLKAEGYNVKWKIIGEGAQRNQLERLISDDKNAKESVMLLGQKINPYPYIRDCDIYFQPSRHEGYGIAVAEARAFNKPIVATDFAGAREQLINEETGMIVSCDSENMYKALKILIEDKKLRKNLTEKLTLAWNNESWQTEMLEKIIKGEAI